MYAVLREISEVDPSDIEKLKKLYMPGHEWKKAAERDRSSLPGAAGDEDDEDGVVLKNLQAQPMSAQRVVDGYEMRQYDAAVFNHPEGKPPYRGVFYAIVATDETRRTHAGPDAALSAMSEEDVTKLKAAGFDVLMDRLFKDPELTRYLDVVNDILYIRSEWITKDV